MRIEFKNFRCLRDTTLDLTPLTVIVGPNASGKSSVLRALDPEFIPTLVDVHQRMRGAECTITRSEPGGASSVTYGGNRGHGHRRLDFRYAYQFLRLDVDALRRPNVVSQALSLTPPGDNLTNVFDTLNREEQRRLVTQFCELVPVFSDVNAKPVSDGSKHLLFTDRWNSSVEYTPAQVSDGSMLVLALLMLHQRQAPEVLAIEELERGIHPYRPGARGVLRRLTTGEIGGRSKRVVLATHSPEVLSCVRLEEVRVLKRNTDGSVGHQRA